MKSANAQRSTVGNQVRNMAARLATMEAIVKRHREVMEGFGQELDRLNVTIEHLMATHVHPDQGDEP